MRCPLAISNAPSPSTGEVKSAPSPLTGEGWDGGGTDKTRASAFTPTSRPRRAEQVPSALCLDATPERDAVPQWPACLRAPPRSHPRKPGRVDRRKRGPFGDLTLETRIGSALERRAIDRLHGRIPQAGRLTRWSRGPNLIWGCDPSQTQRIAAHDRLRGQIPEKHRGPLFRSPAILLHVPARCRFWPQPLMGWRGYGSRLHARSFLDAGLTRATAPALPKP